MINNEYQLIYLINKSRIQNLKLSCGVVRTRSIIYQGVVFTKDSSKCYYSLCTTID